MRTENNILHTSLYNFNLTAKRLNLDNSIRQKILGPKEKIEISIDPVLSKGKVVNVKAFIEKPVKPDTLLAEIEKVLGPRQKTQ